MARFGSFKYGSGQEYGTSPTNANLLYTFMVDWDNDGYFDGTNEAEFMVDFNLSRGRDHLIAPNGQGFERYQAGQCSVTLDNSDGRFNPFNTSSPLYPHVTPGKSVRIAVKNSSTGTDYSLMRGKISDIQPYNTRGRKLVKIDVIDGQQFLADKTVRIGFRQMGSAGVVDNRWSTGRWIDLILERANWPENEWSRTYDLATDYSDNEYQTLEYAWFWNRNAMEGVRELENTELGTFLHDRNGNAQFLSQNFTFDQIISIDESEILTDIALPQPWETLRNRIEITVNPIQLNVVSPIPIVWSIAGLNDQAIPVAAESSFTVDASFRYFNYNVVPSNYAVLFTVNSLADGSGSNLTSQSTAQISEVGDGATITLLNNSVTDGFITSLYVSGDPIYGAFDSVMSAEDNDSIDIYSSRTLSIQSPWTQSPAYAQTMADFLLENLKDPTPFPVIKIEQRPSLQFPLDLYVDVIHLTSDELSLDKLYRIGKISHDWLNDNGQSVLTTLKLEPYYAVGASGEINNLLSPFDDEEEVDGTTPPASERMLWTLDDTWEYGDDEGNPTGSLRHYLVNPAGFSGKMAETDTEGHVILEGEYFSFDYIWIPGIGFGTIGGTDLIRVEINTVELGLPVNETYSPSNYNVWQTATFDLTEYTGDTIANIQFIRAAGAGVGIADQRILFDNVFIGR